MTAANKLSTTKLAIRPLARSSGHAVRDARTVFCDSTPALTEQEDLSVPKTLSELMTCESPKLAE
jgi:hypothetical protein